MIKIILGNSYSQITGLDAHYSGGLRAVLSYTPDNAYYTGRRPVTKYLISKRGDFQTGLLGDVLTYLINSRLEFEMEDKRVIPSFKKPHELKGPVPYPAQLQALQEAIKHSQGTISMTTGSGKSLVIALIASRLNVKTLVVCPTLEIKKQLIEAFRAFKCDMSKIVVENVDSRNLKTLKGFDCLIIDEAHHSAAKTYQNLNKTAWSGIYYRFFLTATPFRNQSEENLLFKGIAGDVIYQLTYAEAVKSQYVVPVEALYFEMPKVICDLSTYRSVYDTMVVRNTARNQKIAELINNLNADHKYTLCLVKEIIHGKILSEMTGVPFATGEDEESKKYITQFAKGEITALIGTTGVVGEGIDTKPCEYVIIAGLGKAKSNFMQQVGRCIRRYGDKVTGKVVLIKDVSHKYLLRHFKEQVKVLLDEYNVKPERIEF